MYHAQRVTERAYGERQREWDKGGEKEEGGYNIEWHGKEQGFSLVKIATIRANIVFQLSEGN